MSGQGAVNGQDRFQIDRRIHRDVSAWRPGHPPASSDHHSQGRAEGRRSDQLQIPTFKLHGSYVVYFAGWKQHYSLYPASSQLVAAFKDELAPYEVNKGTIRFPLSGTVPVKLIGGIARFLAKEAEARAKAKAARPKKRG